MKKQLESKMKNPTNALRNTDLVLHLMEAVVRRRSVKKVFLEISQNSQELNPQDLAKTQPKF